MLLLCCNANARRERLTATSEASALDLDAQDFDDGI
jgi:hypothetical protein